MQSKRLIGKKGDTFSYTIIGGQELKNYVTVDFFMEHKLGLRRVCPHYARCNFSPRATFRLNATT